MDDVGRKHPTVCAFSLLINFPKLLARTNVMSILLAGWNSIWLAIDFLILCQRTRPLISARKKENENNCDNASSGLNLYITVLVCMSVRRLHISTLLARHIRHIERTIRNYFNYRNLPAQRKFIRVCVCVYIIFCCV